MLITKWW